MVFSSCFEVYNYCGRLNLIVGSHFPVLKCSELESGILQYTSQIEETEEKLMRQVFWILDLYDPISPQKHTVRKTVP